MVSFVLFPMFWYVYVFVLRSDVPQYDSAPSLESLTSLMERMLFQTMECLSDERWELRRMGSQVRPFS